MFSSWVHPEIIAKAVTLAVAVRHDDDVVRDTLSMCSQLKAQFGARIELLETEYMDISSSEIRGLLSGGQYAPEEIKDPKAVRVIFESCGSKENPAGINKSVESLKAAGFNAHGYISEGTAHEFLTWRRSLREMAPLLFKK